MLDGQPLHVVEVVNLLKAFAPTERADDDILFGQGGSNPLDDDLGDEISVVDPAAPTSSHQLGWAVEGAESGEGLHNLPVQILLSELRRVLPRELDGIDG